MEFEAKIDKQTTQHASEKKKQGHNQHSKCVAVVRLIDFIAKKSREASYMRHKSVTRHKCANVNHTGLESHGHPN